MARNRVIYQSEALYAVKTGDFTATQVLRVQDVSHTVDIARQDVNEFGKLAAITRSVVEPPTVGTDFSYYLGSGDNENTLGFVVEGFPGNPVSANGINCVSGLIGSDGGLFQKNLYVRTVPEGQDVAYNLGATADSAIGIGNAFITDYTLNAAVGDIPTVSISTEALNMNVTVDTAVAGVLKVTGCGIDLQGEEIGGQPQQSLPVGTTGSQEFGALRPGDITLNFDDGAGAAGEEAMGGASLADAHWQNFSFSLPMSRTSLSKLGSKYAYFKAPDFPVEATVSASAIMSTAVAGNLSGLLCGGDVREISAAFKLNCSADQMFKIKLRGAQLASQNFSSSIGDNQTVDLSWITQIGGPQDTGNGVFMQGGGTA